MAAPILRRSLLYVPGSSQKFLKKSTSLKVDCVAYDLEDSVVPAAKQEAREQIVQYLKENGRPPHIKEIAIRINSVDSGFALDDLNETVLAQSCPRPLHDCLEFICLYVE
jgi:citrate lyase subunit beta-like protein